MWIDPHTDTAVAAIVNCARSSPPGTPSTDAREDEGRGRELQRFASMGTADGAPSTPALPCYVSAIPVTIDEADADADADADGIISLLTYAVGSGDRDRLDVALVPYRTGSAVLAVARAPRMPVGVIGYSTASPRRRLRPSPHRPRTPCRTETGCDAGHSANTLEATQMTSAPGPATSALAAGRTNTPPDGRHRVAAMAERCTGWDVRRDVRLGFRPVRRVRCHHRRRRPACRHPSRPPTDAPAPTRDHRYPPLRHSRRPPHPIPRPNGHLPPGPGPGHPARSGHGRLPGCRT